MSLTKKTTNKAFTLIEIVTVITIIGILMSIAIPNINKYLDKANETKIIGMLNLLNNNYIFMQSESDEDITIEKLISNLKDEEIKLNISGNNFKIGKYEGEFLIENEKVIANVSKPVKAKYTISGKKVF